MMVKSPKKHTKTQRYQSAEDRFYARPQKVRSTPGTGRQGRSFSNPQLRQKIDERKEFDEKAKPFKAILEKSIIQKPLCGEKPSEMMRAPKYLALREKYIEINTPGRTSVIIIDADHNDIHRFKDNMLPEPNYIVINRATGRHHIAYILQDPVSHGDRSQVKPQKFLKHVRNLLTVAFDGDKNYINRITRNPCAHTKEYLSMFIRARPYTLNSLYKLLLDSMPDYQIETAKSWAYLKTNVNNIVGESRNCDIFNIVRKKAYCCVQDYNNKDIFERHISGLCQTLNPKDRPLKFSELKQISKSISKWVWKRKDDLTHRDTVATQPDNYDELCTSDKKAIMRHRCWQVRKKQIVKKLIHYIHNNPFATISECAKHLKVSKGAAHLYYRYATLVITGIKTLEILFGNYEKETTPPAKKRKPYSLKRRRIERLIKIEMLKQAFLKTSPPV